jgi:hypothetical protein
MSRLSHVCGAYGPQGLGAGQLAPRGAVGCNMRGAGAGTWQVEPFSLIPPDEELVVVINGAPGSGVNQLTFALAAVDRANNFLVFVVKSAGVTTDLPVTVDVYRRLVPGP